MCDGNCVIYNTKIKNIPESLDSVQWSFVQILSALNLLTSSGDIHGSITVCGFLQLF